LSQPEKIGEQTTSIVRVTSDERQSIDDVVAVEEPLEIRVVYGVKGKRHGKSLAITMRTPGADQELAAGFLLSENVVRSSSEILSFAAVGKKYGDSPNLSQAGTSSATYTNIMRVELDFDVELKIENLQRHFYTTSSCGICGKASLEAVRAQGMERLLNSDVVSKGLIFGLPDLLRDQQSVFDRTGGLHAAGLVSLSGELLDIREDVGRHNAVDKLIGSQLIAGDFQLADKILVVSGRASFELVQKALMARIPIMVAVGAPSSLAVSLAEEFGMTLVGFTSGERFNVYAGAGRILD
jgi:FdhD protein